jgi:hypothetical protein
MEKRIVRPHPLHRNVKWKEEWRIHRRFVDQGCLAVNEAIYPVDRWTKDPPEGSDALGSDARSGAMRNATIEDLTGWSAETRALVDERLEALARWREANGKPERAAEIVAAAVDGWPYGRASSNLWLKCTRSLLSSEIAELLRSRYPGIESEPGCADVVEELSRGGVLDLDGFLVEGLEAVDFTRPVEDVLESVVEVVRLEGAAIEAEHPAP